MIDIDIKVILLQIKTTLLNGITSNIPAVKEMVDAYIISAEKRLKDLAEGAISGELSYKWVVLRLKEEEITIKDQLLSIGIVIGSDLQDLINKVIGIFTSNVNNVITI